MITTAQASFSRDRIWSAILMQAQARQIDFLNLAAFQVPCTLDPAGDGSAGSCIPGTQHFGSGRNALVVRLISNFDFSIFKTPR